MLAHQERFVVAAFNFFGRAGRSVEVEVPSYAMEAFEDVAFVSD